MFFTLRQPGLYTEARAAYVIDIRTLAAISLEIGEAHGQQLQKRDVQSIP